jgi:hypothetical protein
MNQGKEININQLEEDYQDYVEQWKVPKNEKITEPDILN